MSTEIQQYEHHDTLTLQRPPEQVLAEAKQAATALVTVISQKAHKVMFNKEQYLEFEDWQTVAKFYGCTPKTTSTTFVQYGNVSGWEATAVVLDRHGNVITQADGMCLNDEENWGMVAKYEWQDELDGDGKKIWEDNGKGGKRPRAKKVKVADVPKPLFQLRSMAQTRACARALRQVFAWVVVLAGYRPSVAEEMIEGQDGSQEDPEQKKPVDMPQSSKQQAQGPKPETFTGKVLSVKEVGKGGAWWISIQSIGLALVDEKDFVPEIVAGVTIRATAVKNLTKAGAPYWRVGSIEVVAAEQSAEAKPQEQATEAKAEDIPDAEWSEPEVAKAEAPKTIGVGRAKSIHITRSTNQKTTGLTEPIFAKLLKSLPQPIEHLRDLEVGMEQEMIKICKGEVDWRNFVDE